MTARARTSTRKAKALEVPALPTEPEIANPRGTAAALKARQTAATNKGDTALAAVYEAQLEKLIARYPEIATAKAKAAGKGTVKHKLAGLRASLTRNRGNKARAEQLEAEIAKFIAANPELQPPTTGK